MKGNATIPRAEALLRFMLYTSSDRQQAVVIGRDSWVDRETALGAKFMLNTEHELTAFDDGHEPGRYVVAMLPLIRRVSDPRGGDKAVVHVTVYLARAEEFPLFITVDQLTPGAIRNAMLCSSGQ